MFRGWGVFRHGGHTLLATVSTLQVQSNFDQILPGNESSFFPSCNLFINVYILLISLTNVHFVLGLEIDCPFAVREGDRM